MANGFARLFFLSYSKLNPEFTGEECLVTMDCNITSKCRIRHACCTHAFPWERSFEGKGCFFIRRASVVAASSHSPGPSNHHGALPVVHPPLVGYDSHLPCSLVKHPVSLPAVAWLMLLQLHEVWRHSHCLTPGNFKHPNISTSSQLWSEPIVSGQVKERSWFFCIALINNLGNGIPETHCNYWICLKCPSNVKPPPGNLGSIPIWWSIIPLFRGE